MCFHLSGPIQVYFLCPINGILEQFKIFRANKHNLTFSDTASTRFFLFSVLELTQKQTENIKKMNLLTDANGITIAMMKKKKLNGEIYFFLFMITCHLSPVKFHMSCVTCQMLPVTCHFKNSHSNRPSPL